MAKEITSRSTDYSQWYNDIVYKSGLADQSAVRGCMVIKPHGYALWENIRDVLDKMFKATGHVNAYFQKVCLKQKKKTQKDLPKNALSLLITV
jgi:prolyl-tRNA synthetase